jgi:hypothetical protein
VSGKSLSVICSAHYINKLIVCLRNNDADMSMKMFVTVFREVEICMYEDCILPR